MQEKTNSSNSDREFESLAVQDSVCGLSPSTAAGAGLASPRTASWGVSPSEFTEVLNQLIFRYDKWDTYACGRCSVLPESIVLSRATHEHIVRLVESVASALAKLERRVIGQADLLRALSIPPELIPIITREEASELHIGRYDLFYTREGRWIISEFNEDVPGGYNEAIGLPKIFGGSIGDCTFEGDLEAAFLGSLTQADRTVALFFATGFSEDLQHMTLLADILEKSGRRALLASPAHLRNLFGRPSLGAQPFDAAIRFYPADWIPLLPNYSTWRQIGHRLRMLNPLHRSIRQSKNLFAAWREKPLSDCPEAALLSAATPVTRFFDPADLDEYLQHKDRWVIKHAFGRMGDDVTMGCLESPSEWAQALDEVTKNPVPFTLQERFDIKPLSFEAGELYPTIGVYVVGGRFAGYFARVSETPLTTHRALHVATIVEPAGEHRQAAVSDRLLSHSLECG